MKISLINPTPQKLFDEQKETFLYASSPPLGLKLVHNIMNLDNNLILQQ